jgi:hypothetical protein
MLLCPNGGNVGIGTTSPGSPLDVNGSIRAGNYHILDGSTTAAGAVGFSTSNGPSLEFWGSAAAGSGSLIAKTAGSERARIDSSGTFRVKGAGTAGVTDAFAVNGSAPASSAQIDSSGRLLVGTASDSGGALLQVNGDRVRIATAKTPASSGATGTTGEIAWDADYIYVCTATNTWKRTAISTW